MLPLGLIRPMRGMMLTEWGPNADLGLVVFSWAKSISCSLSLLSQPLWRECHVVAWCAREKSIQVQQRVHKTT